MFLANKYRKKRSHMLKKNQIDIFQVLHCKYHSHMALNLLSTVFTHAQHDTSDCVGLQISFQAEHHSLSEFLKAQFLFTFSTVNKKQVQVVCHILIQEKHGNKWSIIKTLTENGGVYGCPMCQHNPVCLLSTDHQRQDFTLLITSKLTTNHVSRNSVQSTNKSNTLLFCCSFTGK